MIGLRPAGPVGVLRRRPLRPGTRRLDYARAVLRRPSHKEVHTKPDMVQRAPERPFAHAPVVRYLYI